MHRTGSYESQVPAGKTEHLSRPNVEERENSLNRVVSQSESDFSDNLYFGQAIHRHVRYTPEPETSNVCLSSSGTPSVCNRCTESELTGNECTCICTISSDSNLSKNNFGRVMSSVRDCPLRIGQA